MRFTILCTLALAGTASVALNAQAFGKRRNRCETTNHCPTSTCGQSHDVHSSCGCQGGYSSAGGHHNGYAWHAGSAAYGMQSGYAVSGYPAMNATVVQAVPMALSTIEAGSVTTADVKNTNSPPGEGVVQTAGTSPMPSTSSAMPGPTFTTMPATYGSQLSYDAGVQSCCPSYGQSYPVTQRRRGLFRR